MLSKNDLREYRQISGLSLRDVARYCNISAQAIGQIENGDIEISECNHREIINGINMAKQKIADGTFRDEKTKEWEENKIEKKLKQVAKDEEKPKTKTRRTTKSTATKITK